MSKLVCGFYIIRCDKVSYTDYIRICMDVTYLLKWNDKIIVTVLNGTHLCVCVCVWRICLHPNEMQNTRNNNSKTFYKFQMQCERVLCETHKHTHSNIYIYKLYTLMETFTVSIKSHHTHKTVV